MDWQFISCFDPQLIELKPSLFAKLGRNYIVKVSSKTQADNSFPRIINRKIHFWYMRVYILGSLSPLKNSFLSTWCRDATPSLDNNMDMELTHA